MRDHEREEAGIFISAACVAFALIPDRTLDTITNGWEKDTVVDVAGAGVAAEPAIGSLWSTHGEWLAGLFGVVCLLLPCGKRGLILRFGFRGLQVGLVLFGVFHQQFKARIFLQHIPAHPGFSRTTAPSIVD